MELSQRLSAYLNGWVVNLELGGFWGIYIGRLAEFSADYHIVELQIEDVELFKLSGDQINSNPRYELSWSTKYVKPRPVIETSTKLRTEIPYLTCKLVFYTPGLPRPSFEQALKDLREFRYI
jgi:hypothetical protein